MKLFILAILVVIASGELTGGVDTAGLIKRIKKKVTVALHNKLTKTAKWSHKDYVDAAHTLGEALVQLGEEFEEKPKINLRHKPDVTTAQQIVQDIQQAFKTNFTTAKQMRQVFKAAVKAKKPDPCHPHLQKPKLTKFHSETIRRQGAQRICQTLTEGKLAIQGKRIQKLRSKCSKMLKNNSQNFVDIDAVLDEHASIGFKLRNSPGIASAILDTEKSPKQNDNDLLKFACPKIKAVENYDKKHTVALIEQGSFSAQHKKMANSMLDYLECACNDDNQAKCSKLGSDSLSDFMNTFDEGLGRSLYAGSVDTEKKQCAKSKLHKRKTEKKNHVHASSLIQQRQKATKREYGATEKPGGVYEFSVSAGILSCAITWDSSTPAKICTSCTLAEIVTLEICVDPLSKDISIEAKLCVSGVSDIVAVLEKIPGVGDWLNSQGIYGGCYRLGLGGYNWAHQRMFIDIASLCYYVHQIPFKGCVPASLYMRFRTSALFEDQYAWRLQDIGAIGNGLCSQTTQGTYPDFCTPEVRADPVFKPLCDSIKLTSGYACNPYAHVKAEAVLYEAVSFWNGPGWKELSKITVWDQYYSLYSPPDYSLKNLGGSGCTTSKPCANCHGDCDHDGECESGECFQRDDNTKVPGCDTGGSGDVSGYDFCVSNAASRKLVNLGGSGCTSSRRCGKCHGDCDSDSQCGPGLRCFQRSGYTKVPGCDTGGSGDVSGYDYCIRVIDFLNDITRHYGR
jgi:hypothetical protein